MALIPRASTVSEVSDTGRGFVMTEQTTSNSKRRGQAVAGVAAAVLVFAVLVAVFLTVRSSGDDKDATQAAATQPAQAVPAAPAEPLPSSGAAQPSSAAAPAGPLAQEPEVKPGTGTLSKLAIKELVPGTGAEVKSGQTITVNYKLISYTTGDVIDSSWSRDEPFSTRIGTGDLIKGWDQGIPGQKVGSRVQLDVPADLAYGPQQGDLRFVVDILDAK